MQRSNWGLKSGQERILAVRMKRAGWEKALGCAVLTNYEPAVFRSPADWRQQFDAAVVHLQWDPECSIRGEKLPYYSIQVGLSRHIIHEFAEQWITSIEDFTPRVNKIHALLKSGRADQAKRLLPAEKVYPVSKELSRRMLMDRNG